MNTEDIVLVIYINIGQKSIEDATAYMERVQKDIEVKTSKFTCFFIPIRHGDSKIECINPILLDKKDYATKVNKILIDYEIKLIDFLSNPEPVKKVRKKVETDVIKPIQQPPVTIPKTPKKTEIPQPEPEPVIKKKIRSK